MIKWFKSLCSKIKGLFTFSSKQGKESCVRIFVHEVIMPEMGGDNSLTEALNEVEKKCNCCSSEEKSTSKSNKKVSKKKSASKSKKKVSKKK